MIELRNVDKKHPHTSLLVEYAEGLIDTTARLNPEVASHVSSCDVCRATVDEIRGSFKVIEGVESVEAGGDLTASILLAAKRTPVMAVPRTRISISGRLALVAVVLLVTGLAWDSMHQKTAEFVPTSYAEVTPIVQAEVFPGQDMVSSQIESLLTDAVMGGHRAPGNDWERAQHRAVRAYDDDIAEAQLALANNPGFMRASNVVASNREQKTRTLRNVYIESH